MGGGSRIQFPKLISLVLVHSKTELRLRFVEKRGHIEVLGMN